MEKRILILLMLCSVMCACNRSSIDSIDENFAMPSDPSDKLSTNITCHFQVGHDASDCGNSCIAVNGHRIHVDCQGYGRKCSQIAHLQVAEISSNIYEGTTTDATDLTDQQFFNMPARSLCIQTNLNGKSTWLNIPAQLVYRDSISRQFTLSGLFYTDYQYYNND
ncbi:MAG: hypothetical protein MJZ57_06420 [Bacteroidales bacterium]|nr:hypothetical protein [Bacteroidales bacterium]